MWDYVGIVRNKNVLPAHNIALSFSTMKPRYYTSFRVAVIWRSCNPVMTASIVRCATLRHAAGHGSLAIRTPAHWW
jgi:hypothetical protein